MFDFNLVPFEQTLFQLFFDLVKSSGQGLNLDQIEKIRTAAARMSAMVDAQVQLICLEHLKTFQSNIKESVDSLEVRIAKLEVPSYVSSGNFVDARDNHPELIHGRNIKINPTQPI